MKITNKPTPEKLKDITLAAQSNAADHLAQVKHWENLVIAENASVDKGKIEKTRSTVTIKHVRKLLEWRYPVLEQAFLSRENLFNPVGREPRDAKLADVHKLILNYQLNNEIDKTTFISRMVRAYMNQATAVIRLGWKSEKGKINQIKPTFKYDFISPDSDIYPVMEKHYIDTLAELNQAPQAESSLPVHIVEGAKYYDEYSQVMDVTVTGFVEHESEDEEYIYNHPVLDVVSLYDVYAAPECNTNIQDSPYVVFRFTDSIFNLEQNDEYDTDSINWSAVGSLNNDATSIYADDDKRREVEVWEYWGLHDVDGTGTMEQVKVTWVDGYVIECIPNPFPDKKHPFYSAPYSPDVTLDSFYGSGEAFLVEDNQALLSAMHRGIIDIHANSAYGQRGIAKNILDPVNRSKFLKGENFEYDPQVADVNALFKTFEFPQVNPSTMVYMQQINADSDALTGIKSFNEGISGNALGQTAAGVQGVLSATSLREASIVGRLESMLAQIAKRIMQLNILYLDAKKIIQLAGLDGLMIKANPNPLIDVKLDITNQAEDAMKAQELSFMLQTLGQSLPPQLVKETLMEIAELRNMNKFYNSLVNFEMTPPEPSEAQKEIERLQTELLKAQIGEIQARATKGMADSELAKVKVQSESAKAGKTSAETDKITVETDRLTTGQDTEDKIRIISAQGESNAAANLIKSNPVKGFNRQ